MSVTGTILTAAVDAFVSALAERGLNEVLDQLKAEPTKKAFEVAVIRAIHRYAVGSRLALAKPLLDKNSPLNHPMVAMELTYLLPGSEREPDLEKIAQQWQSTLSDDQQWRSFPREVKLFLSYLQDELRQNDIFRPYYNSISLRQIERQLQLQQEQTHRLIDLIGSQYGEMMGRLVGADDAIQGIIDAYNVTHYLEEKLDGFVGRNFVFQRINHFINQRSRGYFLLRGEPGIGKSAIAAKLVRDQGYIHHFNMRTRNVTSTQDFLGNVCAQLIAYYRLPYEKLPPHATENSLFLEQLLHMTADRLAGKKCVILVDALDEAQQPHPTGGANLLYLPENLPEGVYFVATSRETSQSLRILCEYDWFTLKQDDHNNLEDIRSYVTQQLTNPGLQNYIADQQLSDTYFTQLLVEKSQGNFMYLRYVIPEIARGVYQDLKFDALPNGLLQYYLDHWQRIKQADLHAWTAYKLPILAGLVHVQKPVSVDLIAKFAQVERKALVHAVLDEWQQFLYTETIDYQGGTQQRYRIYHASFHDFIANTPVVQEEIERLEPRQKIIQSLLPEAWR